jgi:hypothetical protein
MAKPKLLLSKRMISPRLIQNWELAELERESGIKNLVFTMVRLWLVADEVGIFEWQPRILAPMIYPYSSEDQSFVEPAMNAMVPKFLRKIMVEEEWYGYWPNWGEHNDFRDN